MLFTKTSIFLKERNKMKKFAFCLIGLALLITLTPPSPVVAQGPSGNWTSNLSCQNQSASDATVHLLFYKSETGTEIDLGQETIAANSSHNFIISALPDDSTGSVVVSSDQPVTCSSTLSKDATGTQDNAYRFAASKGFASTETGTTMYVSQVEKDFYNWDSYIAIQNTGGSDTPIKASFIDRYQNNYGPYDYTLPAYGNIILYLEEIAAIPSMFIGGAKIWSVDGTTPLAVTAVFYNSGVSYDTSQIHAYNGATMGSDILYAPYLVRNYYGYNSGISIQNIGGSPTSFKIVFTFNGVNYVYQHPTQLPAGGIKDLYLPDMTPLDPVDGLSNVLRYGKATIYATNTDGSLNPSGELIGNVNQDNRGGSGIPIERMGQGATYTAFLAEAGSQNNYIAKWMNNVGGFTSGYHVSNYTTSSINCDFKFEDADANYSVNIAQNDFHTKYAANVVNLNSGYEHGVRIECDGDVFVISNASVNPGSGKFGDSFYQMSAGTK